MVTKALLRLLALGMAVFWMGCSSSSADSDTGNNEPADTVDSTQSDGFTNADQLNPQDTKDQWKWDAWDISLDGFDIEVIEGGFGWPCHENKECLSDYCVPTEDGSVCTMLCDEECPEGWLCKAALNSYPDIVYICVPFVDTLCDPCESDYDCGAEGDMCLSIGEGSGAAKFCTSDCSVEATCPTNYDCQEVMSLDGVTVIGKQCLPSTGSCFCTPETLNTTRTCEVGNQYGTCYGQETCTGPNGWENCDALVPKNELCNSEDDNCNGQFDEGIAFVDWDESELSVGDDCGTGLCAGGKVVCAGLTLTACSTEAQAKIEWCNGEDDNCNGVIDDGANMCPSYSCTGGDDDYFETGVSWCENGGCVGDNQVGCGLYTCDGGADVGDNCATTCLDDSTCVSSAHCDMATNECKADQANGGPCTQDNYCIGGYCNNGFCCDEGTCCSQPSDCPEEFFEPPTCDSSETCQGHRVDGLCQNGQCSTTGVVEDDSACDTDLQAKDCTPFGAVFCSGKANQDEPVCPSNCTSDQQCLEGYHCDDVCTPDLDNGATCDEASDCMSAHCQNGYCCGQGDCCVAYSDCDAELYTSPSQCINPGSCQGTRQDRSCYDNQCKKSDPVPDDSGCDGLVGSNCGAYLPVYCTAESDQDSPQCSQSCADDSQCDANAHCDESACIVDLPAGINCDEQTDCQDGLYCVDGVCCTSSCSDGACRRCDLPGTKGTCTNVPPGMDPDEECGAMDCSSFYWGWNGNTCHNRKNALAYEVNCNGAGACQAPAELCPTRALGTGTVTCHATCQDQVEGSCADTVAGACVNVSTQTLSCGQGICANTVPNCVNGAPNVCTPLPDTTETCNNLDDNCNGFIDDGITPIDSTMEPNESCESPHDLGTITEGSSTSFQGVLDEGDMDYYRFYGKEVSGLCVPFTDQDFFVTVRVTPPTGDDCTDIRIKLFSDSCGLIEEVTTSGCGVKELIHEHDGDCDLGDDSEHFRVEVSGYDGAGDCAPYTLLIKFEED